MADHVVSLNDKQERALTSATAEHNKLNKEPLTASEFFALKTAGFLDALVRNYEGRIANQMAENFAKLTPEQQADILTRLGVSVG